MGWSLKVVYLIKFLWKGWENLSILQHKMIPERAIMDAILFLNVNSTDTSLDFSDYVPIAYNSFRTTAGEQYSMHRLEHIAWEVSDYLWHCLLRNVCIDFPQKYSKSWIHAYKYSINKVVRMTGIYMSCSMGKPTTWSKFLIGTFLHKNYFHALKYHHLKY